MSTTTYFHSGS